MTGGNRSRVAKTPSVTHEDIGERIRTLIGDTSTTEEREKRTRMYYAKRGCTHCVVCWTPIADRQTVFREKRFNIAAAPVCEVCRSRIRDFDDGTPCEWCQRTVHNPIGNRVRTRTFCCQKCEISVRSRDKHLNKVNERGSYKCIQCLETFEPSRSDARFCSAACKQKHHRNVHRVTDVNLPNVCKNYIRNDRNDE